MKTPMANSPRAASQADAFNLPLDRELLFSNHKGEYKQKIENRQLKLLEKVASLKTFLKPDEKILLLTTGCSPTSFLEQFLTGWIFVYLKRSLLIFTNRRIFHIPTKADYTYRHSIAQILYADCQSIKLRGRTLVVEYKTGMKDKFFYIAGKEKRKIKTLLPTLSLEGTRSKSQQRIHLCPRCTNELETGRYSCPKCDLAFKDKETARKISLLYPGGGYFYARHPVLGLADAFVETVLLVLIIIAVIDVVNGIQLGLFNLIAYSVILALEKALTVYHSSHFIKEYIPEEKDIAAAA